MRKRKAKIGTTRSRVSGTSDMSFAPEQLVFEGNFKKPWAENQIADIRSWKLEQPAWVCGRCPKRCQDGAPIVR